MIKNFFADLDIDLNKKWDSIKSFMSTSSIKFIKFKFVIDLDEEKILKYELNDDISFVADINPDYTCSILYYYRDIELDPNCYYIRPEKYHTVSTLSILHECIKQKTCRPDIKFLEDGKKNNED